VTSVVEPGRRCLGDRYELDRLIAAGGMGQVWRAEDIALRRTVAVKVLRSEYTGEPTFVARFRAEAQHAASLSHPNTAAVFDYGEATAQDGTGETLAYLVMELVSGEPLSNLLARERRLDTETTLSILRQTASALGDAHRAGMVHRDVKPGNILVRPDGSVKLTDFGIAWSARSVALTRTGQVIGTPQYLSPEQAEGRLASPASDVYALGLIGYECLAGRPAFDGDNAVTIALKQVRQDPEPLGDDVPEAVCELIDRALAKDPHGRFADGCAFVEAIDAVLEGRPLPAAPSTTAMARIAAPSPRSATTRPPGPRTGATTSTHYARPPVGRRRRSLAMVVLPLLGLLTGAAIAAALFQSLAGRGPNSPAEAAEVQEQAQTITLDAARYLGRPVEDVVPELEALGLDVERRQVATSDTVPGTVTAVAPDGALHTGDAVVVSYAVAPGTGGTSRDGADVTGAAVDEPDATTTDATTTDAAGQTGGSAATPTTTLPAQGTTATTATSTSETTQTSSPTSESTSPSTGTTSPAETTAADTSA
jgi:eukaryotic-like serine/threonine-protein kinase